MILFAWKNLKARIEDPQFKFELERKIEKVTGGKAHIESYQAYVGFHPWLAIQGFSLVLPDGTLKIAANKARVDMSVLPLLKGNKELRVESLSVKDGRFSFLNPTRSPDPYLQITADIKTDYSNSDQNHDVIMKGRFEFARMTGAFTATGLVVPEKNKPLTWTIDARSENLVWSNPKKALPLEVKAVASSSGTFIATAVWRSTMTEAKATVRSNQWREKIFDYHLNALGGTIAGSGSWKRSEQITVDAKGQRVRLEKIMELFGSPVPWKRTFDFDLSVVDFPIDSNRPATLPNLLDALSRSGSTRLEIGIESSKNEASRIKEMSGTIRPDGSGRSFGATWNVVWDGGGLSGRATVPRARKPNFRVPIDMTIDINSMDLTQLPTLADRFHLTHADMDAVFRWRTASINERMFDLFSSKASWTFDATLRDMSWRDVPFDTFSGQAAWNFPRLRFDNVHGTVSKGTFELNGNAVTNESEKFKTFSVNGTMKNVEVAPFMFAVSTNPVIQSGRFTSTVDLKGNIGPWDYKSLAGTVVVDGRDGQFRAGSFILSLFSRLNLKSLIRTVKGEHRQGYPFDVFAGTSTIAGGRFIISQPLSIKNSSLEIAFKGWGGLDAKSGKGVVVINPMVGTRNLLTVVPGVSSLVLGSHGEFLPLIVDVAYKNGELETNFRSIQTLTDLPMRVIGNIMRLPSTLFRREKKPSASESQ